MMNLELLFWAAELSGNKTLHHIAVSHANRTAAHHVRADGSTFHVVDYNQSTGAVKYQCTAQGLTDSSTWSRGQSWCIYGFAMAYRYSGLQLHLDTAHRCAAFWLSQTAHQGEPADKVPLWDFSWPGPQTKHNRDASAAAIAASGLLELAMHSKGAQSDEYRAAGEQLVSSLGAGYLGDYDQTEGVVVHAAGANPSWSPDNFNVSLVYGGYYAVEAAQRLA